MEPLEQLFNESFPSATPEARARAKSYFQTQPHHKWMFAATLAPEPVQGDIIVEMPSFFFDDGRVRISKTAVPIMLIQHECDLACDANAPRGDNYVFAPLFPFEQVTKRFKDPSTLGSNLITTKLLVKDVPGLNADYVVDFELAGSVSANWLHEQLRAQKLRRIASLSQNGFFFLLAKLSIHFLRGTREPWKGNHAIG